MLVSVSRENDKWIVDSSVASIYPEFRAVLEDSKLGVDAMAYVALGCDTASDNPLGESFENEADRLDESARCVCGESDFIPSHPKVHKAVDKYIRLVDTPYSKGRADLNTALKNVGNYLKTEGQVLTKENIGAYVGAMKTLPDVLLSIKKLNETHASETEEKTSVRVKADKKLGLKSRRYLGEQ